MGRPGTAFDQNQHPHCLLVKAFPPNTAQPASLIDTLLFAFFSFSLLFSPLPAMGRELLDGLTAEVNSRAILHSEIEEKVSKGPLVKISDYPAGETASAFERALQDAINLELVIAHAERLEIEVNEEDIDKQIEGVAKQNRITVAQLKDYLVRQGKSFAEYRRDIHDQILFMRFRGRVLMPQVKVTDKDVESYYLKKVGSASHAVTLHLRSIYFALPDAGQKELYQQKKQLAQEVHRKLKNGLDFYEAEKIYSEMANGREGKAAMAVQLTDLEPRLQEAVKPLEEKTFSEPTPFNQGLYIFYLESKKFADSGDFLRQKKDLEFELRQVELTTQLERWLKEERLKAKIKIFSPLASKPASEK